MSTTICDLRTDPNPPRIRLSTIKLLSNLKAITYIHSGGNVILARLERNEDGTADLVGRLPAPDSVVICELTFTNRPPQRSHAVRVPRAEIEAAQAAGAAMEKPARRNRQANPTKR